MKVSGLLMRAALLACCLVASPAIVLSVTVAYDEALWTKALWSSWKLENPLALLNPIDEMPRLLKGIPEARGAVVSSLDGPVWERPPHHRPGGHAVMGELEALDDVLLLEPASQAAQCLVCHTLLTRAWAWASREVLNGEDVSPSALAARLSQSCEKEVVDALLAKQTLYKMEMQGSSSPLVFFVLRERRPGTQQTAAERQAVRLACKNLIKESSSELVKVLLDALQRYAREADVVRSQALEHAGGQVGHRADGTHAGDAAAPAPAASLDDDEEDEYLDEDDEEEEAEAEAKKKRSRAAEEDEAGGIVAGTVGGGQAAGLPGLDGGGGQRGAAGQQRGEGGADDGPPGEVAPADVGRAVLNAAGIKEIVRKAARALGLQVDIEWGEGVSLEKLVGDGPSLGGEELEEQGDEEEDDCQDRNAKCEMWAASGECDKNPKYMVGNSPQTGHCRRACGLCTPPDPAHQPPAAPVDPALAADLKAFGEALLRAAKNSGCGASRACLTGVSGMALNGGGLIKQQAAAGGEWPRGAAGGGQGRDTRAPTQAAPPDLEWLLRAAYQQRGGFVLGKPFYGRAFIRPAEGAAATDDDGVEGAVGDDQRDSVVRVLLRELRGKVLQLHTEFFVYEYAYRGHVRHYHEEADGSITEAWLLGTFQRESLNVVDGVTGAPAVLDDLDMLPDHRDRMRQAAWPFIKQIYNRGDECVLAGGRREVRRTEVRLACSPDRTSPFVLVREPDFCKYIFVVYLPALCDLPAYAPQPKAQVQ